jgi:O-antigen/teichoic acid export membrane protein
VVAKILTVVITLTLLASGLKLSGVILGQGIAGVLALMFAVRLYGKLDVPAFKVDTRAVRELVGDAAPMFTMGLMVSLQPYLDAIMLSRFAPPTVIGWYGATATFTGTLLAPVVILCSTVYPRLSKTADDPAAFARLVRSTLRPALLLAALGGVGTYLFADVAVSVVYHGPAFKPAATILRVFSGNLFLVSIDCFLAYSILAAGRINLLARAKVVAVVLTTCLEPLLIPWCQARFGNGGIGVTLSFTGGEVVLIACAIALMPAGTLGRRAAADLARAAAAGAGVLGLMTVVVLPPVVAIPLAVAIYTALAVVFGLVTRDDADALFALARRKYPRVESDVATAPAA